MTLRLPCVGHAHIRGGPPGSPALDRSCASSQRLLRASHPEDSGDLLEALCIVGMLVLAARLELASEESSRPAVPRAGRCELRALSGGELMFDASKQSFGPLERLTAIAAEQSHALRSNVRVRLCILAVQPVAGLRALPLGHLRPEG